MTILDSLKKLNKVEGVTDESANTILDALKALYAKKGGTNSTSNTIAEAIDEVSTVAGGGGGGGSSDFSTAEVTLIGQGGSSFGLYQEEYVSEPYGYTGIFAKSEKLTPDPIAHPLVEPDGTTYTLYYIGDSYICYPQNVYISSTGDVAYDEETGLLTITGDCSITGMVDD